MTKTWMLILILLFSFFISVCSFAEQADLVADLNLNQSTGSGIDWSNKVEYQGKIYFSANEGAYGRELYAFDSSTQQAKLIADVNAGTATTVINIFTEQKLNSFSFL